MIWIVLIIVLIFASIFSYDYGSSIADEKKKEEEKREREERFREMQRQIELARSRRELLERKAAEDLRRREVQRKEEEKRKADELRKMEEKRSADGLRRLKESQKVGGLEKVDLHSPVVCGRADENRCGLQEESTKIRDFLMERGVSSVVHFTRLENLEGIMSNGLIGRSALDARGVNYRYNDSLRLDGVVNSISASISFPNYKMFWSLRVQNPEADWVVLRLCPSILWRMKCAFCHTNAANKGVSTIALDDRMGVEALRLMFGDDKMPTLRRVLNIDDSYPTDPQAEVLLLQNVEVKYIKEICFPSMRAVKNIDLARRMMRVLDGNFKYSIDDAMFLPRSDHQYWKKSSI